MANVNIKAPDWLRQMESILEELTFEIVAYRPFPPTPISAEVKHLKNYP